MADLEVHYIRGVYCNKCGVKRLTESLISRFGQEAVSFYAECAADGWSRWVSRSVRDYCPRCKPGTDHQMRQVW